MRLGRKLAVGVVEETDSAMPAVPERVDGAAEGPVTEPGSADPAGRREASPEPVTAG